MPSKNHYSLVDDDILDSRIPLHTEEAFQHGINFQAKYIGSLDIPRPASRVEIVASMRRIRYEFKAKNIKKTNAIFTISLEGVKVYPKKLKKKELCDENANLILQQPIYRIFYVSHDSKELKIFSFISREGGSNVFRCNVFKASSKNQALKIVRTVGQAFEVCNKMTQEIPKEIPPKEIIKSESPIPPPVEQPPQLTTPPSSTIPPPKIQEFEEGETYVSPHSDPFFGSLLSEGSPLNVRLLQHQLEQQAQQTQSALAQVRLLKAQLCAETSSRIEVQAQNEQLLNYNKDLLEHIYRLVNQLHILETKLAVYEGNKTPTLSHKALLPPPLSFRSKLTPSSQDKS